MHNLCSLFYFWPLGWDIDDLSFQTVEMLGWNPFEGKSLFLIADFIIFKVKNQHPSDMMCFLSETKSHMRKVKLAPWGWFLVIWYNRHHVISCLRLFSSSTLSGTFEWYHIPSSWVPNEPTLSGIFYFSPTKNIIFRNV